MRFDPSWFGQDDMGVTPEQMRAVQAISQPIDPMALGGAAATGAGEALTDPDMYAAAFPFMRSLNLAGRGGTVVGGAVNPARNPRAETPNWVWGEAGKGGRSWRWGREGAPTSGSTQQVRRLPAPEGRGGLPATQGGLPATQGGLPATIPSAAGGGGRGGFPAVIPPAGAGAGAGGAATSSGKTLLGLIAAGLGFEGLRRGMEDEPEAPPMEMPMDTGGYRRQRGGPWDQLIAESSSIAGGNTRPFETLNTIDYENIRGMRPDYDTMLAALADTAPEAPAERNWTQDLGKYVVPAIAGGILGGPLGLIMGGLMGEGDRRERNAEEEAAYQERMNEFNREMATTRTETEQDIYGMELDEARAQRQEQAQDYSFGADQRQERRTESDWVDQRGLTRQQMIENAMNQMLTGQQLDMGDFILDQSFSGSGVPGIQPMDSDKVLDIIIQTDPRVIEVLKQTPEFMQAQTLSKGPMQDAAIRMAMQRLELDPTYGPLIKQIQQQNYVRQLQTQF